MEDQAEVWPATAQPMANDNEDVPLDTRLTKLGEEAWAASVEPSTQDEEDVHAAMEDLQMDAPLDERLAELVKCRIINGQLFESRGRRCDARLCLIFHKRHLEEVKQLLEVDTRMSQQKATATSSTTGGFYTYKLQLVLEENEKKRELFNAVVNLAKQAGVRKADLPRLTQARQLNLQEMKGLEQLLAQHTEVSDPCSAAATSRVSRTTTTFTCRTNSRSGSRPLSQAMTMSANEVHDLYVLKHYAERAKALIAKARAKGKAFIGSRHHKAPFYSDGKNEKMVLVSQWIRGFELTNGTTKANAHVDDDELRLLRSDLEEVGSKLVDGFKMVRHLARLERTYANVEDDQPFGTGDKTGEARVRSFMAQAQTFNAQDLLEAADKAAAIAAKIFRLRFATEWIDELHGGRGSDTCGFEPKTDVLFKMSRARRVRLQGAAAKCKKALVCVVTFSNSTMASVEVPIGGAHLPGCWTSREDLKNIPSEQKEFIAAMMKNNARLTDAQVQQAFIEEFDASRAAAKATTAYIAGQRKRLGLLPYLHAIDEEDVRLMVAADPDGKEFRAFKPFGVPVADAANRGVPKESKLDTDMFFMVFANDYMLDEWKQVVGPICIDETYNVSTVSNLRFVTLMGRKGHTGRAAHLAYLLATTCDTRTYQCFFEIMKHELEKRHGVPWRPTALLTDLCTIPFEALKMVVGPDVRSFLCSFHVVQAVKRALPARVKGKHKIDIVNLILTRLSSHKLIFTF